MAKEEKKSPQEKLDAEIDKLKAGRAGSPSACREVLGLGASYDFEGVAAAVHRHIHAWQNNRSAALRDYARLAILSAARLLKEDDRD